MREEFLVFGKPLITDDEIEAVVDVLKSRWIGTGPKVAEFEELFAKYKNFPYAVAVNSCTAALHLSLIAAGIKSGDEVITTPLTFCATVNAIIHCGAMPVFVDVAPDTMNIDPCKIEEKITDRTKALLVVHFAGRPCRMDEICAIAEKHNLKIIEDCAHAIEAEYKGQKVGTFGDFGCFSFYVTKNITTAEGGMVLTGSEEDAAKIKMLALHGMSKDAWRRFSDAGFKHYYVVDSGYKYNMTDIAASIGIVQLKKIDKWRVHRERLWVLYNEELKGLPLKLPADILSDEIKHSYHLYTVLIDEERAGITRDEFLNEMTKKKIGVGVHYLSIPEHPFYRNYCKTEPEDYPVAADIGRRTVSLPLSPAVSESDLDDVVSAVKDILG